MFWEIALKKLCYVVVTLSACLFCRAFFQVSFCFVTFWCVCVGVFHLLEDFCRFGLESLGCRISLLAVLLCVFCLFLFVALKGLG